MGPGKRSGNTLAPAGSEGGPALPGPGLGQRQRCTGCGRAPAAAWMGRGLHCHRSGGRHLGRAIGSTALGPGHQPCPLGPAGVSHGPQTSGMGTGRREAGCRAHGRHCSATGRAVTGAKSLSEGPPSSWAPAGPAAPPGPVRAGPLPAGPPPWPPGRSARSRRCWPLEAAPVSWPRGPRKSLLPQGPRRDRVQGWGSYPRPPPSRAGSRGGMGGRGVLGGSTAQQEEGQGGWQPGAGVRPPLPGARGGPTSDARARLRELQVQVVQLLRGGGAGGDVHVGGRRASCRDRAVSPGGLRAEG